MEVMERALVMERAGARVVHLEVGEPDFPPPEAAVEACRQALLDRETRYTDSRGLLALREAIAAEHARRSGLEVDPDSVLVTNGTSPAMLLVFSLLVEPGDEVILGTPHYPCYPNFIRIAGGVPILVPMEPEQGYVLDVARVRAAITSRTRALVVASPANPTGAVQEDRVLRGLAELGLPLISDEIYHGLEYGGAQATSALGLSEKIFLLDGFSKRYAMTGFRLGYVIAPGEAIRPLQTMAQSLFISASHFVQRAGIAALERGQGSVERMRQAYDRRRTHLVAGLREIGFAVPTEPRGAFYVFADGRRFDRDSKRLAFRLLEQANVACAPGVDFGVAGEGWLRFSYSASDEALREGLERIARLLGC